MASIEAWPEVVCPRDRSGLVLNGETLTCAEGHEYACVDGIPVLLLDDELEPTQPGYWASVDEIAAVRSAEPPATEGDAVDPYVAKLIVGTHGNLYRSLAAGLPRYPIPDLRLGPAQRGELFLDIGCNWGRWTIAASRAGYRPIGIDPSIEAIVAARRIARQLGCSPRYLVADARCLPFADAAFDTVFSYGVLQHFPKSDAAHAIGEIARVLRPRGRSFVQMPNASGVRNVVQRARRGFRDAERFEIRYWHRGELVRGFSVIGTTTLAAEGFLTLNPQPRDLDLLPRRYRLLVRASEALRRASLRIPVLTALADSVAVRSTRAG